ncbi:MAG: hypothetical protein JWO37_955 [Acidimicrobiales bacterium]|nr:hypothetical protein [Acidimicrobiales bacterium]
MILTDPQAVNVAALATRTGWVIKPEGACRGEVCVPLPGGGLRGDGAVDVESLAGRLGMPVVADEAHGLWALGPDTAISGRALTTASLPDIVLPDVRTGEPFAISSLRGQKVLVLAWASW